MIVSQVANNVNERGQVTAFVTIFTVALIFVIGLVVDGGSVLAARRQAANEAAQAARAGAQQLAVDRFRAEGVEALDPERARAAALELLARTGRDGDVTVDEDVVVVTVRIDQPLQILGIGGLADVTVSGTGRARGVQGVNEPLN